MADITRAVCGYNIVVSASANGVVLDMEVGRYWALTRSGARAKAARVMRRKRRADARETVVEVVTDPPSRTTAPQPPAVES